MVFKKFLLVCKNIAVKIWRFPTLVHQISLKCVELIKTVVIVVVVVVGLIEHEGRVAHR